MNDLALSAGRSTASRLEWLDLFRGCAAVIVVLFHFHEPLRISGLSFGFLAVDLFFILSGIVLGLKYTHAIEEGLGFGEFAWIRLRRPRPTDRGRLQPVPEPRRVPKGNYAQGLRAGLSNVFAVLPWLRHDDVISAFPANAPMRRCGRSGPNSHPISCRSSA